MPFDFDPPDGYRSIARFPTTPASEGDFRDSMQSLLDQLRDEMNRIGSLGAGIQAMSRQAIINGNFDVAQRLPTVGATVTNPAHNTYPVADRWKVLNDGGGLPANIVHSRQSLSPGDIMGASSFYRIAPDGAGANPVLYRFTQAIENGVRYLCGLGKKVSVSFWARSSIPGKKLGIFLVQQYGTGGNPSPAEFINGQNFVLNAVWTKYKITFDTNTLVGKTFGSNIDDQLGLHFGLAWDAANQSKNGAVAAENFVGAGNIDIAQVQVNAGDQALPFQPKSFAEELALCQRYYEKSFRNTRAPTQNSADFGGAVSQTAYASSSLPGTAYVSFKVQKRTAPTITTYSPGSADAFWRNSANNASSGGSAVNNINENGMTLFATSQPANDLYYIHWTADAEL